MPYSHPYKPNPDQQTQGHPYAPGGNGSGSDAPNGRRFEERVDEFGRRMEEKVADLDRRVEEWSRRMDEKISGTRDTSEQGDRNTRTTATSGNSVDDFVDNILDLGTNLGTGILGGLAAYPVAKFAMGMEPGGMAVYMVPFLISTVVGSILAFVLLMIFKKNGVLGQIQDTLNS